MERIFSQKWEKAFVFFKHEDEAGGADMAMRFKKLMDSKVKKTIQRKRSTRII